MIRFDDVKDQTTEDYFNNNKFSIDAFNSKYTIKDGETYVKALKRVCDYVASVEKNPEDRIYWSERWFDEIYNDWWHPAGSIMQGAGSGKKISLSNCTTISLGSISEGQEWDSLESIIKNTSYTVAKSAAYRQGLGVDYSRLRPKGTKVLNSANESTGPIHWMKFIDSIGYFVGQKGRIPAMLFSINISHPSVEEFITVKSDHTVIQNANISVQITDDFYKAVEKNEDWELFFEIPSVKKGQKVYIDSESTTLESEKDEKGHYYISKIDREGEKITKKVNARKLLELLAKNMCNNAEPGIQNIDIAKKYSNSDYVYDPKHEYDSRIISTNACSEQYLSRESLCVLASLNVQTFSTDPEEYEKELDKIAHSMNRFLDNVNECELVYGTYATPYQKLAIENLRRTGAGVTNIAGWLFKLGKGYGTEEGNSEFENFARVFNYYLYKSSISLGKEKGNFGLFNRNKLEKSPFIKNMIKQGLEFTHLRNITVSSYAPTGTLSLMFRNLVLSYGIEAPFGLYFWKRTRISGKYEYYFNVPNIVRKVFEKAGFKIPIDSDTILDTWNGDKGREVAKFIDENLEKVGLKFKSDIEVNPFDKLDLMGRVMKYVDSSISTTYVLPEGSDWKTVYDFIIEGHKREVKSIAAFPDKKMYGIVSKIPFKELAFKLKAEGISLHPQNFIEDELKELKISSEEIKISSENAPKRLPVLEADIYSIVAKGEKFLVVIGLQNGVPYEIFGGHMNGFGIKNKTLKGTITKNGSKNYTLEFGDITIEDFSKQFTPVEQILFRMLSLHLRRGVPIQDIVEQLQKGSDDIVSLTSAVARVLKKYIKDGQKLNKKCQNCQEGELIYIDGCVSCSSCSYSKCS